MSTAEFVKQANEAFEEFRIQMFTGQRLLGDLSALNQKNQIGLKTKLIFGPKQ